jgi:hypothetical protein
MADKSYLRTVLQSQTDIDRLIFILQIQIGGIPRVLECLRRILADSYPNGPYNAAHQTHYPLNRRGILYDLTLFIRTMWNLGSLSSVSSQLGVCLDDVALLSLIFQLISRLNCA